jgi:hypothetical protein
VSNLKWQIDASTHPQIDHYPWLLQRIESTTRPPESITRLLLLRIPKGLPNTTSRTATRKQRTLTRTRTKQLPQKLENHDTDRQLVFRLAPHAASFNPRLNTMRIHNSLSSALATTTFLRLTKLLKRWQITNWHKFWQIYTTVKTEWDFRTTHSSNNRTKLLVEPLMTYQPRMRQRQLLMQ